MTDKIQLPSLLPYLQSGSGKFHLTIKLEPADESSPFEPSHNPFQFEDVSDPFSLLGKAGLLSDLSDQILPLSLLVQRSHYHSASEDARNFTNLSVERQWQQIFSLLSNPLLKSLPFLLAEQIGKQGQLLPFRSLFYCRATQIFFPPPCPGCGKELELCTDDTLLSLSGLEGYSTSSRRFLYCPDCCSDTATGTYYALSRTEKDPGCVSDIQQLIKGWSLSEKTASPDSLLPCRSCPSYKVCYGNNTLAVNALCCFSFYPFHMLLLKVDSGVGLNFRALLSGKAQPQDCLAGKENPPETAPLIPTAEPVTSEPMPEPDISNAMKSANAAIRAILGDISTKWENSGQEKQTPPVGKITQPPSIPSFPQSEHADLMETVILSSPSTPPDASQARDHETSDMLQEEAGFDPEKTGAYSHQFDPAATVLLQHTISKDPSPRKEPFESAIKSSPAQLLQETIILSPQTGRQQSHLKPSPLPETTDSETIHGGQAPLPDEKTLAGDLAETIIQRPVKKSV